MVLHDGRNQAIACSSNANDQSHHSRPPSPQPPSLWHRQYQPTIQYNIPVQQQREEREHQWVPTILVGTLTRTLLHCHWIPCCTIHACGRLMLCAEYCIFASILAHRVVVY